MMHRVVIVILILCVSLSVNGRAQSPVPAGASQQPGVTFKADVNFVEIHAVVTDERGNPIKDLVQDDFEVIEDGKPQTPSVFSLVDLPIERPLTRRTRRHPLNRTSGRSHGALRVVSMYWCWTTCTRQHCVHNSCAMRPSDSYNTMLGKTIWRRWSTPAAGRTPRRN